MANSRASKDLAHALVQKKMQNKMHKGKKNMPKMKMKSY